jgi:hypothetical protein
MRCITIQQRMQVLKAMDECKFLRPGDIAKRSNLTRPTVQRYLSEMGTSAVEWRLVRGHHKNGAGVFVWRRKPGAIEALSREFTRFMPETLVARSIRLEREAKRRSV